MCGADERDGLVFRIGSTLLGLCELVGETELWVTQGTSVSRGLWSAIPCKCDRYSTLLLPVLILICAVPNLR